MVYESFSGLYALLLSLPGAQRDFKFEWGWDRYLVGGKMFAAMMCPGGEHDPVYAGHPLLNLKADPEESLRLRARYPDILPGFYADKRCWVSIRLDGAVPPAQVEELCRRSYELVFAKLPKKVRLELQGGGEPCWKR